MHPFLKALCASTAILMTPAFSGSLSAEPFSDAERAWIRKEMRAYLLENPEIILEMRDVFEARERERQIALDKTLIAENTTDLHDSATSPWLGNPDAPVTIVKFSDYNCPYCTQVAGGLDALLAEHDDVRVVVKNVAFLGPSSEIAARFAAATYLTAGQGAFASVHEKLFAIPGEKALGAIRRAVSDLGLPLEAIVEAMDSEQVDQEIAEAASLAQTMQVTGTPTLVFGRDGITRGAVGLETLKEARRAVLDNNEGE